MPFLQIRRGKKLRDRQTS